MTRDNRRNQTIIGKMITYQTAPYIRGYGKPLLVNVVEMDMAAEILTEEYYAFFPEALITAEGTQPLITRQTQPLRRTFAEIGIPENCITETLIMERSTAAIELIKDFLLSLGRDSMREYFNADTAYKAEPSQSAPFERFKRLGVFVKDMERISAETKSDALRTVIKAALTAPTIGGRS